MTALISASVFAALGVYWALLHRAAQASSWGRVRKTDLENAVERLSRSLNEMQVAMATLLAPTILRALDQLAELADAMKALPRRATR